MKTRWFLFLLATTILILAIDRAPLRAYDNDGRDAEGNGLYRGGPHRTINELALDALPLISQDQRLRKARLRESWELTGPTVVDRGMELIVSGDRSHPFRWWVMEGGYDADEPELYNSFRHFYDPSRPATPYLTDHLDELDYVYRALIFAGIAATGGTLGAGSAVTGAAAGGGAALTTMNPRVNARDWALTGQGNQGWGDNQYCLEKGKDYLRQAYEARDLQTRRRFFAQAWRALGETMHLLADMTCVPHVRNDSHPGKAVPWKPLLNTDPNFGYLRNDPYEFFCNEQMVRAVKDNPAPPEMKAAIDRISDPAELFKTVATYTQENFISADTIGGDLRWPTGEVFPQKPANGQAIYQLPSLSECTVDVDSGLLYRKIDGRNVRIAHISWMGKSGWADGGWIVASDCVRDQASILIPLAIYANARLAELFLPRVRFADGTYDAATKRYQFTVRHLPGALDDNEYPIPMLHGERMFAWVNEQEQPNTLVVTTEGERSYCDLSRLTLNPRDKVVLGIELGGIVYPGESFDIPGDAPAQNAYIPSYSWVVKSGSGQTLATGDGATFSQAFPQKVFNNQGAACTVTTTLSGAIVAPQVPNGAQQFTTKISITQTRSSTPAVPGLKGVSALAIIGYNGTPPRVVSTLAPENPATISLQLDFNLVNNGIYHLDQTATPRFDYPEASTVPYSHDRGYRGNWCIGTFAGTKGITLNGNIGFSYQLYTSSDDLPIQEQGKLGYYLTVNVSYRRQP